MITMKSNEKIRLITENIKKLAEMLNKVPTKRDYLKHFGNPQFENIGGFSKMLEEAGFIRNRYTNLSDEEIKKFFLDYIKENGIPVSHKFPKILPSYDLVCDRFGSYKEFLNSIGYDTLEKKYTKEEIINILRKGIDTGEIKSIFDLNKKGFPAPSTIYKALGTSSWKETLILINRELNSSYVRKEKYNFSKEELKEMYFDLSKKLNKNIKGASEVDVRKHLGITISVFERAFNKRFLALRKEWGFQVIERNIYTKDNISKILNEKIKDKGRNLTLREIICDKDIPALSTIYRVFHKTSIKKIYIEIKKREE